MENENKISVVINTYNAERHLSKVLTSVKDFDEVLVCDMESTDKTVEIAKKHNCRVVTFPKANHHSAEPARNFAIQSATHTWVLVVDADEIVSEELKNYLYDSIKDDDCPAGLYIPRKNFVMNKFIKTTYPNYQLRFFRRDAANWPPYVHTFPTIDGETGKIPSKHEELAFTHISDTVYERLCKINQYTENEVDKRCDEHISLLSIILKCTHRFVKCYFLKGGFLYGIRGLARDVTGVQTCALPIL